MLYNRLPPRRLSSAIRVVLTGTRQYMLTGSPILPDDTMAAPVELALRLPGQ